MSFSRHLFRGQNYSRVSNAKSWLSTWNAIPSVIAIPVENFWQGQVWVPVPYCHGWPPDLKPWFGRLSEPTDICHVSETGCYLTEFCISVGGHISYANHKTNVVLSSVHSLPLSLTNFYVNLSVHHTVCWVNDIFKLRARASMGTNVGLSVCV